MKLENKESNYSATVIKINHLNELEGANNLVGIPIHGLQAISSKDTEVGTIGIIFPAGCQLSQEYCRENNLFRKKELNANPEVAGYLEDTGRVKALKLIKGRHISSALFMPLSSLAHMGIDFNGLQEGDSFTHINGVEICRKYVIRQTPGNGGNKTRGLKKKFVRIDAKLFPEHWDTDSYFKNDFKYKPHDYVIITQKLHGTSARFANQKVLKLTRWHRVDLWLQNKLGKIYETIRPYIPFRLKTEYEFDTLAGSRRVIKDTKSGKVNENYYVEDLWNTWLLKIQHVIPKNWILYGEIIGWVNQNKWIQEDYTYDLSPGQSDLYIYRISVVNEDGISVDLSWKQIKCFCQENGLKYVPELFKGHFHECDINTFISTNYFKDGYFNAVPLCPESPCDEGVCIRKEDSFIPYVTKAKSPVFIAHEHGVMDKGEADIESVESVNQDEVV